MIISLRRRYGQFATTSGAQLLLLLIGAKLESRVGWLVCVSLMAAVSLIAWLSTLCRRRAIADTPTSRIASAAQGYVELRGTGRPLDDPPLLSHLTSLPCLWYRYRVEEKIRRKNGAHRQQRRESDVALILEDGSGRCVIDVRPRGDPDPAQGKLGQGRLPLYRMETADQRFDLRARRFSIDWRRHASSTPQATSRRCSPGWKNDGATLLERFDLNDDGAIDVKE